MTTTTTATTKPATKSAPRSIVALKLPGPVPALISLARAIVQSMTGNAAFATPVPALADVTTAINSLATSEAAALARTQGAVATRNDQRAALVTMLQELQGYVQKQADANRDTATAIVLSAGMQVRKAPVRAPRVFAAKPGTVSGAVKLEAASAGHRASYEWQYSTDGGKTWVFAPATTQGKTTVAGLPSGTTVQFRYLAVTPKGGQGDWSPAVSLLVK